jgi:tetratricopeptide (TPR) repeat protein
LAVNARAYGAASATAAFSLNNRGECLIALGRASEALAPLRRSLAVWQAQIGPDHSFLGYPLTALGRALVALGRAREAIPPLRRALRPREAGTEAVDLAETRFALARALWDADSKDAASVDRWLADPAAR